MAQEPESQKNAGLEKILSFMQEEADKAGKQQ